jgi:HTH-type transcriptional regulator, competence development regulator
MGTKDEVSHRGVTRSGVKPRVERSQQRPRSPGPRQDEDVVARVEDPGESAPAVGHVLRRAREYWELSLRDVERRIGRSNAYLSQVERGLIRRPDPVLLLELADLYRLDFFTLATWAGWTESGGATEHRGDQFDSLGHLLRRILQLDDSQRTKLLEHVEGLLKASRT